MPVCIVIISFYCHYVILLELNMKLLPTVFNLIKWPAFLVAFRGFLFLFFFFLSSAATPWPTLSCEFAISIVDCRLRSLR